MSFETFSLVPFEHGKHMAVVFKRLPAVTFCGMLIRPQSTAGPCRGTPRNPALPPAPPTFLSFCLPSRLGSALSGSRRRRRHCPSTAAVSKINISLHVLLITTNLNLCNPSLPHSPALPPSFPRPTALPLILSPLTFSTGNKCAQNYFDPLSAEQTDPRHSRTAGVSAEDELELSMPFSVIIVLLGSLKGGERDHW